MIRLASLATLSILLNAINLQASNPIQIDGKKLKLRTITSPELIAIPIETPAEDHYREQAIRQADGTLKQVSVEEDGTVTYSIEATAQIIRKPSGKYYLSRLERPGFAASLTPITRKQAINGGFPVKNFDNNCAIL